MNEKFYQVLRLHLYGLSFISAGIGASASAILANLIGNVEISVVMALLLFALRFVFYTVGVVLRNELG